MSVFDRIDFEQAPLDITPSEFIKGVNEALDDEAMSQRFAAAQLRLFESVAPLHGLAQEAATLKKQEKFLKRQINTMKDNLRLQKQLDEDEVVVPPPVIGSVFSEEKGAGLESDEEANDDYDDEEEDEDYKGTLPADEDEVSDGDEDDEMLKRVIPSKLRKELLDMGVPAPLLNLDIDALNPGTLDVARMKLELVSAPYRGDPCFLFAVKPSVEEDGEMVEVMKMLLLLGEVCDGSTPSLSGYAGASDFREHVVVGVTYVGSSSLERVIRSADDGDIRVLRTAQVALAHDLALAVRRLHASGVVHGSIGADRVMVTLQPCSAVLLFVGGVSARAQMSRWKEK